MQRNLIITVVMMAFLFGLNSCLPQDKQAKQTFVNLAEINAKIERKEGPSEVLEKEAAGSEAEKEGPVRKTIVPPKGAGNEYLKSFTPTEPAAPEAYEGEGILLNFDNADIYICGQEAACTALKSKIESVNPKNSTFFIEDFH